MNSMMNRAVLKTEVMIMVIIAVFLISFHLTWAGQSSSNFRIHSDVISAGGDISVAEYSNISVIGQATAVGMSQTATYQNYAGFLYTIQYNDRQKPMNLPFIPILLLSD